MDPKLFPEGQCRLILIGKTGNGKSATGNTILGFPAFETHWGINSGTQYGDLNSTDYNGLELQVVDTPGLHDTKLPDDKIMRRITQSLLAITPGPHAILLCLSCEQRFSPQEMDVVETLKHAFGEKMMSYLIVVLVRRDRLEAAGMKFEDQLKNNTKLIELMTQINNRYVLFDNSPELSEDKKRRQVLQLLQYVAAIVQQNGTTCFKHRLSSEMDSSMHAIKQAELRKQEQQPRKMPREPKSPPVLSRLAEAKTEEEEDADDSNPMQSALLHLKEFGHVKKGVEHFEAGASQELTSLEMASKFTLKTKKEQRVKGRTAPVTGCREERTAGNKLAQDSDATAPPQKPDRIHPREAGADVETATTDISCFHFQPQDSSSNQGVKTGSAPSKRFVYEVPDKPGMRMKEKQIMVEEVLKRKLARNERLSDEQMKELEKASQSLGKKLREGMAKFKVHALGLCRLM